MGDSTLEIGQNPFVAQYQQMLQDPEVQRLKVEHPDAYAQLVRDANARMQGIRPTPAAQATARGSMVTGTGAMAPGSVPGTGTFTVRKPLSAAEQQTAIGLRSTLDQLKAARASLVQIGRDRWNAAHGSKSVGGVDTSGALSRWWRGFGRTHGMSEANPNNDPEIDALNKTMAQIVTNEGQTQAALMKQAGTRNYAFVDKVRGHLPSPTGDYDYNLTNLNNLLSDEGPYQSWLKDAGINSPTIPQPALPPAPQASPTMSYEDWKKSHGF